LVKAIGLAVLLASFASVSSAGPVTSIICKIDPKFGKICATKAPEVDPASAAAGLTLLMGGLVVLRGRRSKKPDA